MIKYAITGSPVLIYADPNKQYHLFTDALNHMWSGVLTQTGETFNGKWEIRYYLSPYHLSIWNVHFEAKLIGVH